MLYLLDADTLITGDRRAYPLRRFPIFWEWLRHQGTLGTVKVPLEQYAPLLCARLEAENRSHFESLPATPVKTKFVLEERHVRELKSARTFAKNVNAKIKFSNPGC